MAVKKERGSAEWESAEWESARVRSPESGVGEWESAEYGVGSPSVRAGAAPGHPWPDWRSPGAGCGPAGVHGEAYGSPMTAARARCAAVTLCVPVRPESMSRIRARGLRCVGGMLRSPRRLDCCVHCSAAPEPGKLPGGGRWFRCSRWSPRTELCRWGPRTYRRNCQGRASFHTKGTRIRSTAPAGPSSISVIRLPAGTIQ